MTGRQNQRAESLVAINAAVLSRVASGEPLPVVLETLARAVEAQAPGWLASILVADDDGARLRHGAAPSLPDAYNQAVDGIAIAPATGSCGTAAHRREAVVVEDVMTDPLWSDFRDLAASHGLRSCWSVPVCSGDGDDRQVVGTFALYHREPRRPGPDELALVEAATDLARLAIEHERVGRQLSQSEQRFRLMATEVPVGIFQADADGRNAFANECLCRMVGRTQRQIAGEGWMDHVHPDDRAAVLAGWEAAVVAPSEWASEFRVVTPGGDVRHVAATARALRDADGRLTGFLGTYVDRTEAKRAHERERQFEREHMIATTLQRSLLPQDLPTIPGAQVAACYVAGGAGMEVGGDWYDVFALPDDRIGMAIGDVVGRGLGAAVVMGQLRTALRCLAMVIDGPAEVVRRLGVIAEGLVGDQMATLVYGVVDLGRHSFRFSCAGHPPPLVHAPGAPPSYLAGGRGLPLGVTVAGTFDTGESVVDLAPGSTLLLYTDGLVERRDTSIDEGFDALASAMTGEGDDLQTLCDEMVGTLRAAESGDDVALVALRLEG